MSKRERSSIRVEVERKFIEAMSWPLLERDEALMKRFACIEKPTWSQLTGPFSGPFGEDDADGRWRREIVCDVRAVFGVPRDDMGRDRAVYQAGGYVSVSGGGLDDARKEPFDGLGAIMVRVSGAQLIKCRAANVDGTHPTPSEWLYACQYYSVHEALEHARTQALMSLNVALIRSIMACGDLHAPHILKTSL